MSQARREAHSPEHLFHAQEKSAALIKAFVAGIEPSEQNGQSHKMALALPEVAHSSNNQVLLIDGRRGSGKTALLHRLLKDWRESFERWSSGDAPSSGGRVVFPLRLLDLQPIHRERSLAMALVARFAPVVDAVREALGSPREDVAPWAPADRRGRQGGSSLAWEALARSVAGWSGQALRRRELIDPDLFALELRDETTAGLELHNVFGRLITALIADLHQMYCGRGSNGKPDIVFVVPFDDADMVPGRAAELLTLVRTLSHPNVVFLLTGDSDLFRRGLRTDILKQLWSGFNALPADGTQTSIVDPATYAYKLAHEIYERCIPETQRYTQELGESAWTFPKHEGKAPELPGVPKNSLLDWFRRWRDSTYRRLLQPMPDEGSTQSPSRRRGVAQHRLRPLIDVLRGLEQDFEHESEEVYGETEQSDQLARAMIVRLWRSALANSPTLSLPERESLQNALRERGFGPGGRKQLELQTSALRVRPQFREVDLPRVKVSLIMFDEIRLEYSPLRRVSTEPRVLSTTLAEVFALAHDYIVLAQRGDGLIGRNAAVVLSETAGAFVSGPDNQRLKWPLPPFRTFDSFDRFLDSWRQLQIHAQDKPEDLHSWLLRAYLVSAATSMAGNRNTADLRSLGKEGGWTAVTEIVHQQLRVVDRLSPATSYRNREWFAVGANLLAAPQIPIAIDEKNRLLATFGRSVDSPDQILKEYEAWLEQNGAPASTWDPTPPPAPARADPFANIAIPHDNGSFTRGEPRTIAGYLDTSRRREHRYELDHLTPVSIEQFLMSPRSQQIRAGEVLLDVEDVRWDSKITGHQLICLVAADLRADLDGVEVMTPAARAVLMGPWANDWFEFPELPAPYDVELLVEGLNKDAKPSRERPRNEDDAAAGFMDRLLCVMSIINFRVVSSLPMRPDAEMPAQFARMLGPRRHELAYETRDSLRWRAFAEWRTRLLAPPRPEEVPQQVSEWIQESIGLLAGIPAE